MLELKIKKLKKGIYIIIVVIECERRGGKKGAKRSKKERELFIIVLSLSLVLFS